MKQNLNLFFAIAILVMAAHSCTKSGDTVDDDDTVTESQQSPSVGELVNIQIGAFESTTKVSYDPNDDKSVYAFSWEAGEMISIVVPDTDYNENQKFTAVTSEVSTIFNGQIGTWTDQKTLYAISPYSEEGYTIDSTNQTFFYDNSSQTIDASTTDYYSNSLMVSAVDNATVVSSTEYNIPDLKFSQVMSFFELELTNIPSDERCTTVGFETDLDLFVTSADINLIDGSITPLTYSNRVSIDIDNQSGTEATFNLALLPADLSNVPITLFVTTISATNTKEYVYQIENGINFTANTFYSNSSGTLSLTNYFSEVGAGLSSLDDFNNGVIPSNDIWVITDTEATTTEFEGLKSALANVQADDSSRCISIEFPYLNSFPDNALYDMFTSYPISSISAPNAISIGENAFRNIVSLKNIDFPLATSIGWYSFFYCSSLESVNLPSATSIGYGAFSNCLSLEIVKFPLATYVESSAFQSCALLESVEFPSVTEIGSSAFQNCTLLKSATFPLVTSFNTDTFYNCMSLKSVYFPLATSVGSYAFYGCSSLANVEFPLAKSIGENAFQGCTLLESVEFPLATSIGSSSFGSSWDSSACISLKSVNMPLVTTVGSSAFYDCASLDNVNFSLVKTVGDSAFRGCSSLKSICLPLTTSIGASVFFNCSSLKSVDLPLAASVGSYAFYGCSSLVDSNIPLVTSIGSFAFQNCTSLSNLEFPAVTTISSSAFYGCNALQIMSLATNGDAVLSVIGIDAFRISDSTTNEENITLTLGLSNSVNVDDNTLTVKTSIYSAASEISYTFNKIILSNGLQLNFEATANDGIGAKW